MSQPPVEHDPAPPPGIPPERVEEFVRLLGQHQRRIFLYVMCLVPNRTEAEEIVQDTTLVLWREFARFQPGTNFPAWACRVAFHRVLAWRKKKQRDRLEFSPAFLDAVAEETSAEAERLEERSEALGRCIEKLPADHRELLQRRYHDGQSVEDMAREVGRTVEAIYRALSRIRHALHDCVTRSLAQES
jgi:RNA polymerase sigma-70 factor (ECF subfamily)